MAQQPPQLVFTREEAESLGVTKPTDLWNLVEHANQLVGRPPISGAEIGAVGLASLGRVFLGVNIEFSDHSTYSITATKFLLANLALNSEKHLFHCVFADTCGPERFQIEFFKHDVRKLLVQQNNRLALSDPKLARDICSDTDHCPHRKCRALAAANKSVAECPSGVALVDDGGRMYQGWYLEEMKYDLDLGPVKMALVDFVARGEGKGFDKITKAVLVEEKDAPVTQEYPSKLLLKKIAPNCKFNVIHCYKKPKDD